jgi:hypothetical protein
MIMMLISLEDILIKKKNTEAHLVIHAIKRVDLEIKIEYI